MGGEPSLQCLFSIVVPVGMCGHSPNIALESYTQRLRHHPAENQDEAARSENKHL